MSPSSDDTGLTPSDLALVSTCATRQAAHERGLVALSMGIPYWVFHLDGHYHLLVEVASRAQVAREVALFEREVAGPTPAGGPAAPPAPPAIALAWLYCVCLAGAFLWQRATGPWSVETFGNDTLALFERAEWWRPATALALHGDLAHLLGNMAFGAWFTLLAARSLGASIAALGILLGGVLGNARADAPDLASTEFAPPMERQELWAAGVTYFRSRDARMEESEKSGGDIFYDRVYEAQRPELFIKGGRSRTVGHRQQVAIRSDSEWDVPEPELTLAVSPLGKIFGFTIGNDVSSRSIEGENLLYLPQAKVWRRSAALGPCLLLAGSIDSSTPIALRIERAGAPAFTGETTLSQMKRSLEELVGFLMRDNIFPDGCYLMTGTGIVPGADFTLQSGDTVSITIPGIGTLANTVE